MEAEEFQMHACHLLWQNIAYATVGWEPERGQGRAQSVCQWPNCEASPYSNSGHLYPLSLWGCWDFCFPNHSHVNLWALLGKWWCYCSWKDKFRLNHHHKHSGVGHPHPLPVTNPDITAGFLPGWPTRPAWLSESGKMSENRRMKSNRAALVCSLERGVLGSVWNTRWSNCAKLAGRRAGSRN